MPEDVTPTKIPQSARRGSILRREALEHFRRRQSVVSADTRGECGENKADEKAPSKLKGVRLAWARASAPLAEGGHHRSSSTSTSGTEDSEGKSKGSEYMHQKGNAAEKISTEATMTKRGSKPHTRELLQRSEGRRDQKDARHRNSRLAGKKELEESTVKEIQNAFQELHIPMLGEEDDPAGVIYMDDSLMNKTVDVAFFVELGHSIKDTRKQLFELALRRRSLVEEIRAQDRRAESGFLRDPTASLVHERLSNEIDAARIKTEDKLKRLLRHRQRLIDVLKESEGNDRKPLAAAAAAAAAAEAALRSEEPTLKLSGATGPGSFSATRRRPRRSSFEGMKELAKDLMLRETPAIEGMRGAAGSHAPGPAPSRSECRNGIAAEKPKDSKTAPKIKSIKKELDQGWREVFREIFPEEGKTNAGMITVVPSEESRRREVKEAHLQKWVSMSTAREHLDLLIATMDPNKSNELPSVVKCVVTYYTGPGAEELDLLLGGRMATNNVQVLVEMTLEALDGAHAEHVPSILLLQWLLARAPHLRASLLQGGVLRRTFRRLRVMEAGGRGAGERAVQYAALSLVVGSLFC